MPDEKKMLKLPHHIILEDRKLMTVTGVNDIDSFDEQTVEVYTEYGELIIKGMNLHINKIDVDTGELSVEGEIYSITYTDSAQNKGGFFSRLFR